MQDLPWSKNSGIFSCDITRAKNTVGDKKNQPQGSLQKCPGFIFNYD
jgi:hypothetical protein